MSHSKINFLIPNLRIYSIWTLVRSDEVKLKIKEESGEKVKTFQTDRVCHRRCATHSVELHYVFFCQRLQMCNFNVICKSSRSANMISWRRFRRSINSNSVNNNGDEKRLNLTHFQYFLISTQYSKYLYV